MSGEHFRAADGINDTPVSAADPLPVTIISGGSGGGAVTVADGADVTLGAKADAAAGTGTVTAMAVLKQLHLDMVAATPAGTAIIGKVGIDQTTDGTTNAVSAAGRTASGASMTANPLTRGGLAKTANPTAVADGQVVNALHDKLGKTIAVPAIRDLKGIQKTTITSSTTETVIVTAVASTFLDLYSLIITNTSATACNVTIKDATAGTTRYIFAVPAATTVGFNRDAGSAAVQAVVNTNWTATCSASVASIEITAEYVKNT